MIPKKVQIAPMYTTSIFSPKEDIYYLLAYRTSRKNGVKRSAFRINAV